MRLSPVTDLDASPRPGPRWPAWAWAAAVALAMHLWLLADGPRASGPRQARPGDAAVRALSVRQIARPVAMPSDAPAVAAARAPAPAVVTRGATLRHAPRPAAAAAPPPATTGVDAPAAAVAAASPDGDEPPLTYATRLPAPFVRSFEVRRGAVAGAGELRFERAGGGYELTLQTRLAGRDALGLSSRGQVDTNGLAPERHATLRRGRERLAAHFDHDAQRITYSGPQVVNELRPGGQDRLSWMVQLPAIVEADPAAFGAGARIRVPVSGARGDSATWVFVVQGLDEGLLHLVREPLRPYDTRAEIWLDPADQHLPARVRLIHAPATDGLELRRTDAANGAS